MVTARPDLGDLYRDTRLRLVALVGTLDESERVLPVPACPHWKVMDVIYHLLAVAEDVLAGRLTGPPTDEETAAQVQRHQGTPVPTILEQWASLASSFEELIRTATVWPAVLDLASHEQDIRGALGRPGGRDSPAIHYGAAALCQRASGIPIGIEVRWEDGEGHMGPEDGPQLVLRSSRFETVRWRLGRRSRAQLARLDWSSDPAPVLDHLCLFGPADTDIIE